MIQAVIFDLDGLLLDSEPLWERAKRDVTREAGGRWHERAQREMMGMSSREWAAYMHEALAVPLPPPAIDAAVLARMESLYRERLPLVDGAVEAVARLARWPLGLASSSNRELIDLALELAGLTGAFRETLSSEEVGRGKPAPDVYLEAARRLGAKPSACAAVEDSRPGVLAARAAGMRVIAVPNTAYPPGGEALEAADLVLPSLRSLDAGAVDPGARA